MVVHNELCDSKKEKKQWTAVTCQEIIEEFSGVGEGRIEAACSAKSAALDSLRSSLKCVTQFVTEYSNNSDARAPRLSHQLASRGEPRGENEGTGQEGGLDGFDFVVFPHGGSFRHTRSRGRADSHPRVQPRILEYRGQFRKFAGKGPGFI